MWPQSKAVGRVGDSFLGGGDFPPSSLNNTLGGVQVGNFEIWAWKAAAANLLPGKNRASKNLNGEMPQKTANYAK